MLQALLHGKLSREQENMEDVLTSNVFGLLQYVPANEGIIPFLSRAQDVQARFPLDWIKETAENAIDDIDYSFWPFWSEKDTNSCEPDVVIRMRQQRGRKVIILIEAKYRSPKSSEANEAEHPNDQLAREWDNLIQVARREEAEPYLIYLTNSTGIPVSEIEDSIAEFQQKRPHEKSQPQILSLSWRELPELFNQSQNSLLKDMCSMSSRLGLYFYHGVHLPQMEQVWKWRFAPFPSRWIQAERFLEIKWRFNA